MYEFVLAYITLFLFREILDIESVSGRRGRGRRPRQISVSGLQEDDQRREQELRLSTPILPPPRVSQQTPQQVRLERRSRAEQGQEIRSSSLSESGPSRNRGHPTMERLAAEAGNHASSIMRFFTILIKFISIHMQTCCN